METLFQDVRYGLRMLAKTPSFTLVVVLTLALGIGINASTFSLISAQLLRRPAVHDPDHLVVVVATNPAQGPDSDRSPLSVPEFLAWREHAQSFDEIAAAEPRDVSLTGQGRPERLNALRVTASYFHVIGFSAEAGRVFSRGEDQAGREHVVVLSHGLWQRRFGSDPGLIGKTIALDGDICTLVGVMPKEFTRAFYPVDIWIPLVFTPAQRSTIDGAPRELTVYARLKPGITVERAKAEMATPASRFAPAELKSKTDWSASVMSLQDYSVTRSVRNGLTLLMAVVAFVLLIVCANLASLLVARSVTREKEFAVRVALGAGRWRVIPQLLVENLLAALLGGGAGLLLAFWGVTCFARD